ncbi:acetyltransferase [Pseudalkalibacillus hwajinpoensis]|uniref:acetyltransferase n=1 Tax=Guptibacillus hwajinpoensis TaxID=208199 RepID=UPI001CD53105|nr:acetyltransferase [Pseudalkalibacillus hwajinpoensis]MCA0991377.1 acetyltransferase [Pseudalkalibacillus hwajinpoensis]
MRERLIIIGASGHGKVVADIALKMNRWKEIAFLDDDEQRKSALGFEVVGKSNDVINYIDDSDIVVGIGNNEIRQKIQSEIEEMGASIPVLVHPNAVIGEEVEFGAGTVVMAGVVINCSTRIGRGCIINTSASVDHDNVIEEYVHVSPGVRLAGTVKVGYKTWLGMGSLITNNVNVVSNSIVGAGSIVLKNINESGKYVGSPVRKIH